MTKLFLEIVNMSIAAAWTVLAVSCLRLLLKKAPKWITVLLWGIVAIRLILPFSPESILSLIPSSETISPEIMTDATPQIDSGIPFLNNSVNPLLVSAYPSTDLRSANPLQIQIPILSFIWILGVAVLLIYLAASFLRLNTKMNTAVLLEKNVYLSENTASPFVLGLFKPRIYLPFHLDENERQIIIAHEKAHIRRKDHLWKPFGFILLSIHWFNPLIWLAYILLCRDIELACDEKVVKNLNAEERADYSQVLLNCSAKSRTVTACPVAFGEVGVKSRVKSILNYKKPAFWIIVLALILGITAAVCFLTDPKAEEENTKILRYDSKIYTDYPGVYLSISDLETTQDGKGIFYAVWHNETDREITFGEQYSIQYHDGDSWMDVNTEELFFNEIAHLLGAQSTFEKTYSTEKFDLSQKGTYRLIAPFSAEYNTWVEFSVGTASENSQVPVITANSVEVLKQKYPMYFELDPANGLKVFVWQLAKNSYSCGLLPANSQGDNNTELFRLAENPASLEEMRTIVASYGISRSLIDIVPAFMPHSSYSYIIDSDYQKSVEELFWSDFPIIQQSSNNPCNDTASFDIDKDGKSELLRISAGPTAGLFTVCFSVYEEGFLEYFNIFQFPSYTSLEFSNDDSEKLVLIGTQNDRKETIGIDLYEGNIILSCDEMNISHWGEQGIDSVYAPDQTKPLMAEAQQAITSFLAQQYSSEENDGIVPLQSFYILANEVISGTPKLSDREHIEIETYYLTVLSMEFKITDTIEEVAGKYIPMVISFQIKEGGTYVLKDYWAPGAGETYEEEVRNRFPGDSAEDALNPEAYAEILTRDVWQKAITYQSNEMKKELRCGMFQ